LLNHPIKALESDIIHPLNLNLQPSFAPLPLDRRSFMRSGLNPHPRCDPGGYAAEKQIPISMSKLKSLTVLVAVMLASMNMSFGGNKPLKVYILVGQSNMQGHALPSTFPGMLVDPATKDLYKKFVDESGNAKVYEDVQVASLGRGNGPLTTGFGPRGDKFGPELGFGVTIYDRLKEPALIIKASWGGKNLSNDFRPPSSGPYEFGEKQQQNWSEERRKKHTEATGNYYRLMAEHVKKVLADPGQYHPAYNEDAGYEIAGFVWFQGWNDMIDGETYPERGKPGSYELYSKLLADFISDVRKDFKAPEMPFVIGVMGVDGLDDEKKAFRDAMAVPAAMPEFKGNVIAVETAPFWDDKLGELSMRMWWSRNQRYDKEKKYAELNKKILPLLKEEAAAKQLKGAERRDKESEIKAKIDSIVYSPEELELMKITISNGPYHYLGSAKIVGPIGEAFANALIDLKQ